jgi:hypothetical protein
MTIARKVSDEREKESLLDIYNDAIKLKYPFKEEET